MYKYPQAFKASTIWIKPENVYKVSTDQGVFTIRAARLDYKQTIRNYYEKGYTNVHITHIGQAV